LLMSLTMVWPAFSDDLRGIEGGSSGALSPISQPAEPEVDVLVASPETAPAPGDWGGVRFKAGMSAASTFTNVSISYATTGLSFDGVGGSYSNLTISGSSSDGLRVNGAGIVPSLSSTTIQSGLADGVDITGGAGIALSGSVISGNAGYAVATDGSFPALSLSGVVATANGAGNVIARRAGVGVTTSETWTSALPWVLTDFITSPWQILTVQSGGHLTLEPGTTIRFRPSQSISVYGELTAIGTLSQPIVMTPHDPTAGPGYWRQLSIFKQTGGPESTLSWVRIDRAGQSGNPALYVSGSSAVFDHVSVIDSGSAGLSVAGAAPRFHFLSVSGANGPGVLVGNGNPMFRQSIFEQNQSGMQFASTPFAVDAKLCYWGAAGGPAGGGLTVASGVVYEPWLASPANEAFYVSDAIRVNRTFNSTIGIDTSLSFQTTASGTWTARLIDANSVVVRTCPAPGRPGA
jgi:hypothetical protein